MADKELQRLGTQAGREKILTHNKMCKILSCLLKCTREMLPRAMQQSTSLAQDRVRGSSVYNRTHSVQGSAHFLHMNKTGFAVLRPLPASVPISIKVPFFIPYIYLTINIFQGADII